MGYYHTFLAKQKKELKEAEELLKKEANRKHYLKYKDKEYYKKNYEKQKEISRQYYWKNREAILEKNKMKKLYTNQYYKEWYQLNKNQVNQIRSNNNKPNIKPDIKPIVKTPKSFIISF
jgi:hypothetical protein